MCVGGDGSVAELCHAVVLRAQLDADSPEKPVKPVLPLGIIPAGEKEDMQHVDPHTVALHCTETHISILQYVETDGQGVCLSVFTGSTDVVSCSVHGVRDPVTAALHVVLGRFYLF